MKASSPAIILILVSGLVAAATLTLASHASAGKAEPTSLEGSVAGTDPYLVGSRPVGSSVCSPARSHASGDSDETIVSGGLTREYILHVPPSYNGTDASPLVFNFHGLGSSDVQQAGYSGLNAKADAAGFITVAPQGLSTESLSQAHWNISLAPPETNEPDDVGFVEDLLDSLESELCIDSARVYSTGMSNGAQMSVRLACSLSDRIAAIAPVAGGYWPPLSDDIPEPAGCASMTRPVPVIAFHGSADTIVPFDGGLGTLGLNFRLSIEDAIAEWAASNGCDGVPQEAQAAPGVRLVSYLGCDESALVELYVVEDADGDGPNTEGGGHTWPDAALDISTLGATTHEISANDLMWDFFIAHPLADSDGDGLLDVDDNCPTLATPWTVPAGDDDCDGFTTAVEDFVGTDPLTLCGVGAWPPDFNDDGSVSIADVLALKLAFNSQTGDTNYEQRLDLNADARISIADVLALKPVFNLSCA